MGIIDEIKSVAKVVKQAGNIELYQKILDLQAQALELIEEKATLKSQLRELQDTKAIGQSLVFEANGYWRNTPDNLREGPFCSSCWDSKNVLVRLHDISSHACYGCPACRIVLNKDGGMPNCQTVAEYNMGRDISR